MPSTTLYYATLVIENGSTPGTFDIAPQGEKAHNIALSRSVAGAHNAKSCSPLKTLGTKRGSICQAPLDILLLDITSINFALLDIVPLDIMPRSLLSTA